MKLRPLLGISLALAASLTAQAPPGYHLGVPVPLPDSLIEVLAGGRFRATVSRSSGTAADARLIAAAEQLSPSAELILSSARNPAERDRLLAMSAGTVLAPYKVPQRSAGSPTDRWWLGSFDATWIPFAVTGGAVRYYLERLRDLGSARGPFEFKDTDQPDHGSFSYTARALPTSEPGATHVVELRLAWDYWCSMDCGISFVHTRRVFFDGAGRVIRVEGDGQPMVAVS